MGNNTPYTPPNSQKFPCADEPAHTAIGELGSSTQAAFDILLGQMDQFHANATAIFEGPNALQGQRATRYHTQTLPQLKKIFDAAHEDLTNIGSTLNTYAPQERQSYVGQFMSEMDTFYGNYASQCDNVFILGGLGLGNYVRFNYDHGIREFYHDLIVGRLDISGGFWGFAMGALSFVSGVESFLFNEPDNFDDNIRTWRDQLRAYDEDTASTIHGLLADGGSVWNAAISAAGQQAVSTGAGAGAAGLGAMAGLGGGGGPTVGGGPGVPPIGGVPGGPPVSGPPVDGSPPGGGNPPPGVRPVSGGVGGTPGGAPVPAAALAGTWLDKPGATNQFPEPKNMEDIAKEVIRSQGGKFRLLLLTRFGRHDQNNWLVTIPDQGNNNPTQDPGDPGIKPDLGADTQNGGSPLGAMGALGATPGGSLLPSSGAGNTLPTPATPTDPNSFLNNAQATQSEFSGKLSTYGQFVAQAIQQYCSPKSPDQPTSPLHPAELWLVGHGLGGMVAQNLASQAPFPGDNAHLSGAHVVKSVVAFGCPIVGVAAKGVSYDYYEIAGDRVGDIPVASGVNDSRSHDIHTLGNPFTSPPWQSSNPGAPDYVKDPNDPAVIHGGYADSDQLSKIKLPFQILAGGVWGPTYVVAIPPTPGAQATPTPVSASSTLAAPGAPVGLPTP